MVEVQTRWQWICSLHIRRKEYTAPIVLENLVQFQQLVLTLEQKIT